MSKVTFLPVSIGGGLLAGLIGKKLFGVIWGAIDDQEPPSAGTARSACPGWSSPFWSREPCSP